MSLVLLGSVSLGLQYIWGPSRRLRGLRIDIHPESATPLDAKNLLQVLQDSFRGPMPILILRSRHCEQKWIAQGLHVYPLMDESN